jgi:hypothetical protein
MLALEMVSVLAIMLPCLIVLANVTRMNGLCGAPFSPAPQNNGWSGIGYGIVFNVLSFDGFEGAATLGEELRNPRRNIPMAILGTCALAGAFYAVVAYTQIVGFGLGATKDLAAANAPLNDLGIRYVSNNFARAIDLSASVSTFALCAGAGRIRPDDRQGELLKVVDEKARTSGLKRKITLGRCCLEKGRVPPRSVRPSPHFANKWRPEELAKRISLDFSPRHVRSRIEGKS